MITEWDIVPMVGGRPEVDTRDEKGRSVSDVSWGDEAGATAVEYGLIAGAVGIAFVVAGPSLWNAMLTLLDAILDGMVG